MKEDLASLILDAREEKVGEDELELVSVGPTEARIRRRRSHLLAAVPF
jgi:uncharacterized small protein (DUF1192 family)